MQTKMIQLRKLTKKNGGKVITKVISSDFFFSFIFENQIQFVQHISPLCLGSSLVLPADLLIQYGSLSPPAGHFDFP